MLEVMRIVPYHTRFINESGVDTEEARRLRVIVIPKPYLHSADDVPESMRYAVAAQPPLSYAEQAELQSRVEKDGELSTALRVNPEEQMGFGFIAEHGGVEKPHLGKAAKLAEHAAAVLDIGVARIILNELIHNDELEIYQPEDFPDSSDYHLEPRHYLLVR